MKNFSNIIAEKNAYENMKENIKNISQEKSTTLSKSF